MRQGSWNNKPITKLNMEVEKPGSQNNVGGLAHGKDHIGQQVTGLIIAYDHTDAGEHRKECITYRMPSKLY